MLWSPRGSEQGRGSDISEQPPDSPISNQRLEEAAQRIASVWRHVRKRAPKEVNRRVRLVLEGIYGVVNAAEDNVRDRLSLARELERLDAELRGRQTFVPQFYCDGKLAVTYACEPIKIRGAVDHARIAASFERYAGPAERLTTRVNYFLERAGFQVEAPKSTKPWEQPYASFQEYYELLWGRVSRGSGNPDPRGG